MSLLKRVAMLAGLCLGAFLLTWRIGGQRQAHVTAGVRLVSEMAVFPNCRFGVTAGNDVLDYDVASLNVGWYLNWSTWNSPPQPGGAEFMQMVRLEQVAWGYIVSPPTTTLLSLVDTHPGSTWLIGNEPDGNPIADDTDSMDPTIYARAYHDLYELIKNRDPGAQIAIGPIIQPTPLRFEYLDTVWNTYWQEYGETMPVDVWNIHSFILRETKVSPNPDPCVEGDGPIWGAYVPRGSIAESGELYCVRDQDDLDIFWQRIRDFRQWMADRGERNKPLIITEYGVLFPEDYSDEDGVAFSADRVATYMTGTFELLLNETDPLIGYPYDGNRLVQRWAWFSLSQDPYAWGGTLFDPATHQLRELGQQFQNYTTAISPTVDLLAAEAVTLPAVYWHADAPVTATLKAVVSNIGNISATVPVSVTFYDGPPGEAGTQMIGAPVVFSGRVGGCADFVTFETQWPGLPAGAHPFFVQVTGGGDNQSTNNVVEGRVLVASWRVFLSATFKGQ